MKYTTRTQLEVLAHELRPGQTFKLAEHHHDIVFMALDKRHTSLDPNPVWCANLKTGVLDFVGKNDRVHVVEPDNMTFRPVTTEDTDNE